MGHIAGKTAIAFCMVLISANLIFAQTLNLQDIPSDKIQFKLNYDKPFYNDQHGLSTSTNVLDLDFNLPVSSKLNIIWNIPYVFYNYKYDNIYSNYSYSKNGFGNIFLGAQARAYSSLNIKSIITFGIYLPTASEDAAGSGIAAEYYYFSKYLPNSLDLYFNYAYHRINTEGINYGIEAGPNLLIPTKSEGNKTELLLHYGIIGGYCINKFLFSAELLGIMMVSEDIQDAGDRFVHLLDLGAQWEGNRISPKIFYQIYLRQEIRNSVKGVIGIGISVNIDRW